MSQPEVSVVIATQSRRALLAQAVASVRSQDGVDWELVVVDDGSTDDTRDWLERNLEAPRERWLSRPAVGRPEAANAGLAAARGGYVLFLDDDDLLLRDALALLAGALRGRPDATAAVGPRMRTHRGATHRMSHPARRLVRDMSLELLARWGAVPAQVLMPAAAARTAGGFPDDWPSDDRGLLMALAASGPFVLVPEPVMFYRTHAGQHVKPPDMEAIYRRQAAEAIARLPPERRRAGRAAWVAGRRLERGKAALRAGSPGRALALFAGAFLTAPGVCRSPAIWPSLAYDALTACGQLAALLLPQRASSRR